MATAGESIPEWMDQGSDPAEFKVERDRRLAIFLIEVNYRGFASLCLFGKYASTSWLGVRNHDGAWSVLVIRTMAVRPSDESRFRAGLE